MKLQQKLMIMAVAGLAPMVVQADEDQSRWYLNPAIGIQNFDNPRDLHSKETAILGAEYRFGKNWASELRLMDSSPGGINDIDLRQYAIDALYYFGGDDFISPYVALGLGHAEFDGNTNEDQETQFNAGFGLRFNLSDVWSLRADSRAIYGHDDSTVDGLVSLGLSYAFGGKAKPAPAPAPADSDGDGVIDDRDQCPTTPAGVAVDANGCALDDDGDGVANHKDACPETPAGREVDERGCKYVLKSTEEITLNVNFASNSSEVTAAYMAEVEKVAVFMTKYANVSAVIEGHTDNTGRDSYNKKLSQRRADAVKAVLVEQFSITADRLSAAGYGEEQPIATNDTAEGRKSNRRVVAVMKAEIEQ